MDEAVTRHSARPVGPYILSAVVLAVAWGAVTLCSFFLARSLLPQGDQRVLSLVPIAVLAGLMAAGFAARGLWSRVGFTPPSRWRQTGVLAVPGLLVLLPLVSGIRPVTPDLLVVLLVGYALTGLAEEGVFRGLMLDLLRPLGPLRAAALAAVLFGLVHLSNILIRGNPPVILAQAVGAACFGFGYAALRYRTGTVVPLILLHFLTDFFLQIGSLPLIPVAVAQDTVLLGLGIVILSRKEPVDVV